MLLPDLSLFLLVPILLLYVFLFVKRLLRFGRAFRKRDFLDWKISFFRNFGTNLRFRVRPNFQAILHEHMWIVALRSLICFCSSSIPA